MLDIFVISSMPLIFAYAACRRLPPPFDADAAAAG
jgi:hypothetical protein